MEKTFFLLAQFEPKLFDLHNKIEAEAEAAVSPFLEIQLEDDASPPIDDVLDSLVGDLWDDYKPQFCKLVGDFAENKISWSHDHYDYFYSQLLELTRKTVLKKAFKLGYH